MTAANNKLIEVERDLSGTAQAKAKVISQYLLPQTVVPKLVVQTKKGVIYSLTGQDAKPIPNQQLRRKDKHLEVEVDGQVVLELRDFFASGQAQPEGALYWVDGTGLETGGIFISAETPTTAADGTIAWNAGASTTPVDDDVVALAPAVVGINPVVGALAAGGAVGAAAGGGGGGGGTAAGSGGTVDALAAALAKIEAYNNGNGTTPPALTLVDYQNAGITGVTADNLTAVNAQVLGSNAGGADTAPEIQALVNSVNSALNKIADYAGTNAALPNAADYTSAGVTGVPNVDAINSAIKAQRGTDNKDGNEDDRYAADTTAEVQAIVNAYKVLLDAADGKADGDTLPTQEQYALLGVTGIDAPTEVSLMGSVIDRKAGTDVDTVAEVQALADLANLFLGVAAVADNNYTGPLPTAADWAALGVAGVTAKNLGFLNSLLYSDDGDQDEDGITGDAFSASAFDTVAEIQELVDLFFNPPVI